EAANADLEDPRTMRFQNWCGGGMLALFLTASFASIDWILSLDIWYYSTIFGVLVAMSQAMAAFAFAIAGSVFLSRDSIDRQKLGDLGNLLLTTVILFMYMAFSQYLITWAGQIKAE